MSATIKVTDLRKSFKDNAVLKGVTFEVRPGEIFALLGANGAGKTTAINILSTLMESDGGSAVVAGRDVAGDPAGVRAAISLTGQFAAVDDVLTGRENLHLIARLRREQDPAAVAAALLAKFGLADAADKPAAQYSGGMRRRLDIAMSLVGSPQVIFLDEPTTGLDPEGRLEVWETVKGLASSGTTILLTTQTLDEAEALADRIAILHGGTIIAEGTLAELQALFPPAQEEWVVKQPTLEEIFLSITRRAAGTPDAATERTAAHRTATDRTSKEA